MFEPLENARLLYEERIKRAEQRRWIQQLHRESIRPNRTLLKISTVLIDTGEHLRRIAHQQKRVTR